VARAVISRDRGHAGGALAARRMRARPTAGRDGACLLARSRRGRHGTNRRAAMGSIPLGTFFLLPLAAEVQVRSDGQQVPPPLVATGLAGHRGRFGSAPGHCLEKGAL